MSLATRVVTTGVARILVDRGDMFTFGRVIDGGMPVAAVGSPAALFSVFEAWFCSAAAAATPS